MRIVCARAREGNWDKEGCWRTLNYLICKRCARSTCFMRISREWHGAGHACNRRTTVWIGAHHAFNRHPEGVTSTQPRASERSDATPWVRQDAFRCAPGGGKSSDRTHVSSVPRPGYQRHPAPAPQQPPPVPACNVRAPRRGNELPAQGKRAKRRDTLG